jgi:hypothetical protein
MTRRGLTSPRLRGEAGSRPCAIRVRGLFTGSDSRLCPLTRFAGADALQIDLSPQAGKGNAPCCFNMTGICDSCAGLEN